MVEKMFWTNPYLTRLDTRISGVSGQQITVEQTIFYAFSGGQESDHGTIGGYSVLQAQKDGHEIVYTVEEGHGLKVGDEVTMTIDWDRRYRLMRLHFAAEIVLELVYKHLNGIEKIGAHIAQEKARIDFAWNEPISSSFPVIEKQFREIVGADLDISSAFSDEEKERRYWEIEGFSKVACGGTHLKKTGEVGFIKLKRNNIGRGKERIDIYLTE
ncbi:alanine--tRNA ligase-related protein [Paenibacillus flagellatus]|uniref:Alanyl-tRNA editing protein n=1 Tax=Paenibacillus flagellatus TaxID=2211139 RepID=A0A2V5JXZ7_9BACL|nr:alanyl-tRNA editing protein [Paenibacillus flagellatus]PYI51591.1 alanyl-tRNA editing protein [Paenibacillus flagellatus]